MEYCKKCGNEIKDGNKFCIKCGNPINSEAKKDNEIINNVEVKITYNEYKKLRKIFPIKFLRTFTILSIVWVVISLIAIIPDEEVESITISELIIADLFLILCSLVISAIISLLFRKSDYKKLITNDIDNVNYTVYFYSDYIIRKGENIKQKIDYVRIKKYRETNLTLYLLLNKEDIIPIPKNSIDNNLVNHIKCSIDNSLSLDKKVNMDDYINENNKHIGKYKIINAILIIIFILTLFTPWISLGFWGFLTLKHGAIDFESFKYTYGALYALPLPVISLILGVIYNKKNGIRSLKNIISGAIMIGLILLMCITSLTSYSYDKDYSEIYVYKDLIGIKLPNEGKYSRIEWDSSYLLGHISHVVRFTNKTESNKFYENIKNSENWITKDKIGTTLNNFIPDSLICSSKMNECYYSVYIEELNSYNTIPESDGNYHIHTMFYDPNIKALKIEDFMYQYKN